VNTLRLPEYGVSNTLNLFIAGARFFANEWASVHALPIAVRFERVDDGFKIKCEDSIVDTMNIDQSASASELISNRIAELNDWRGETLHLIRELIKQAVPDVVEEWKWRGVPVWSYHGMICTGETYKAVVKLTFAKGASLQDEAQLFNASLEGNVRRAIDIPKGCSVDAAAFISLVREAALLNQARALEPKGKRP